MNNMTVVEYMNSFGNHGYTEEDALEQLIRSHRNIREARLNYSLYMRNLPKWKKWLCIQLGLHTYGY